MPMKIEGKNNSIEILIIGVITVIGLIGNGLNMKVLSNQSVKRVKTFRYLASLAVIDIFLLVFCFAHKISISGYLLIPKSYTKIAFKIISYFFNFLSQTNVWTYTALNISKAMSMIDEYKHKNNNKSHYIKIIISICIILLILNLDCFIFLDFNQINQQSITKDPKILNRTHQFVYNYIIKPKRNFTKTKIDLILKKTNLLKLNETDQETYGFHFENYDYDNIWYKTRTVIRLILFDSIPVLINLTSSLVILIYTNKLTDKKRIKFNKQFVYLFISMNILFVTDRLINMISAIYFKFNQYQLESFQARILFQIISISRHSFSFCIYFSTLKTYRSVISKFFSKKANLTENIPIVNQNFSKFLINASKLTEMTLQTDLKRKSTSQYLSIDNIPLRSMSREVSHNFQRSKSLDNSWIESSFANQNSNH